MRRLIFACILCIAFSQTIICQTSEKKEKTVVSQNFLPYRGHRKPVEITDFYMISVSAGESGKMIFIDAVFTQEIDPRSVKPSGVLINSKAISSSSRIAFNKDGNKFRIILTEDVTIPFSFEVIDIHSYNGAVIYDGGIPALRENETYIYNKEAGLWQRS